MSQASQLTGSSGKSINPAGEERSCGLPSTASERSCPPSSSSARSSPLSKMRGLALIVPCDPASTFVEPSPGTSIATVAVFPSSASCSGSKSNRSASISSKHRRAKGSGLNTERPLPRLRAPAVSSSRALSSAMSPSSSSSGVSSSKTSRIDEPGSASWNWAKSTRRQPSKPMGGPFVTERTASWTWRARSAAR